MSSGPAFHCRATYYLKLHTVIPAINRSSFLAEARSQYCCGRETSDRSVASLIILLSPSMKFRRQAKLKSRALSEWVPREEEKKKIVSLMSALTIARNHGRLKQYYPPRGLYYHEETGQLRRSRKIKPALIRRRWYVTNHFVRAANHRVAPARNIFALRE